MFVAVFKTVLFVTMGIFAVFISDFRKKKDMVPLINEKITTILKFSYFVPLALCVYTLLTIEQILPYDYLALALIVLGTTVVVKSKFDLGICHTWAGYCKKSSKLEVSGIYAYIRHPLYTGVLLFSLGELVMLMFQAPLFRTLTAFVMGLLMVNFLTFAATKETAYLTKHLGEQFIKYKQSVHPFLPLKKYR